MEGLMLVHVFARDPRSCPSCTIHVSCCVTLVSAGPVVARAASTASPASERCILLWHQAWQNEVYGIFCWVNFHCGSGVSLFPDDMHVESCCVAEERGHEYASCVSLVWKNLPSLTEEPGVHTGLCLSAEH